MYFFSCEFIHHHFLYDMKKGLYIFIICCLAIVSCESSSQHNSANNQQNDSEYEEDHYLIENIIDSCFSEMPNVMNNDMTKQVFADTLKTRIQKYRGKSLAFLKEIPMQYEMCLPYEGNKYYVVKFSTNFDFDKYEMSFQVLTKMEKDQMTNLIDKNLYYIDGTFVDFANTSAKTGFRLPSGRYFEDYPRILSLYKLRVDLGTLITKDLTYGPCDN